MQQPISTGLHRKRIHPGTDANGVNDGSLRVMLCMRLLEPASFCNERMGMLFSNGDLQDIKALCNGPMKIEHIM